MIAIVVTMATIVYTHFTRQSHMSLTLSDDALKFRLKGWYVIREGSIASQHQTMQHLSPVGTKDNLTLPSEKVPNTAWTILQAPWLPLVSVIVFVSNFLQWFSCLCCLQVLAHTYTHHFQLKRWLTSALQRHPPCLSLQEGQTMLANTTTQRHQRNSIYGHPMQRPSGSEDGGP